MYEGTESNIRPYDGIPTLIFNQFINLCSSSFIKSIILCAISSNHINDAAFSHDFSPKTFHQSIKSEREPLLYCSGSEPMNNLPCDTKTIPAPTVMHTVISSRNHGCALDRAVTGQVDGSVNGAADGVLNLSI